LSEAQLRYAALDADILLRLRKAMIKELTANGLTRIAEIEFSCVHSFSQAELIALGLGIADGSFNYEAVVEWLRSHLDLQD